jgi:geranylgeranyl diphosphate synthase type II
VDITSYLQEKKALVDAALFRYLPAEDAFPPTIFQAMRYSIFAGGKRVRPILSIAAAEAVQGDGEAVLPVACALEMLHTYSLIHDDLPAMDNDDYRRGKLTNHKMFGEAIAILAGDALLTHTFELLTHPDLMQRFPPDRVLRVAHEIAKASGTFGMIGGQVVDIQSEGKQVDLPTMEYIHAHKTGALIRAAVRSGGILGGGTPEAIEALSTYGAHIGFAFQIIDDILDIKGQEHLLGKKTGSDVNKKKATFPSVIGLEESARRAQQVLEKALSTLEPFGEHGEALREIARFIVEREF